jgi:Predicted integral membrane protein
LYNFKSFNAIAENNHKRITTLFDSITSIAMTMMALQIPVTGLHTLDKNAFLILFYQITVYLISFIALASIWATHSILYSSFKTLGSLGYMLTNIVLLGTQCGATPFFCAEVSPAY